MCRKISTVIIALGLLLLVTCSELLSPQTELFSPAVDTPISASGRASVKSNPVSLFLDGGTTILVVAILGVVAIICIWWVSKMILAIERTDSRKTKKHLAGRTGRCFHWLVRIITRIF